MDNRDLAATMGRWWTAFVGGSHAIRSYTEEVVKVRFEVCPLCEGRGQYVNPSIDSHGISAEEMHELGPEFSDDYRSGAYDVNCERCDGLRVVPVPTDPDVLADVLEQEQAAYEDALQMAAERRAGC